MPDPQVTFQAPQDVSLEGAMRDLGESGGKLEVVGKPKPASLEDALGLSEARGREPAQRPHPALEKIVGDDEGTDMEGLSAEVVSKLARLEAENQFLNSEKGRYGREVVGPLRKENDELRQRLDALEAGLKSAAAPPAAPPDPAQYARQLFGPNVDVEDPQVKEQVQLALTVLDAAERGTQAYVNPVLQELKQLRQDLSGTRDLAASGLTLDQVQKAEEAFPELQELPDSSKFALIRRLSDASKDKPTPERDSQGRFLAGDARTTVRPEHFVEGSSGAVPIGYAGDDDSNQKWQRRMQRFKSLARDQKAGGARAQTHVFLDMLRNGEFRQ